MRLHALYTVLIAIALGGCYESTSTVWKTDESHALPTGTGRYSCIASNGHRSRMEVRSRSAGGYEFHGQSEGKPFVAPMSVHNISRNRYVFVIYGDEGGQKTQLMHFALVNRGTVEMYRIGAEAQKQLERKFGVSISGYKLSGSATKQRSFIEAAALEEPELIELTCSRG